mmetsp:Transcript_19220/g.46160  ORF Transcript_19220/g.46160 Transcript_19220/m.46160 type:complete len:159 (-) Transcript_19220:170-646(-)|eukprot:CAMPEP_0181096418 /NCGR_PEP_ID=MMETSP1071-20121207/11023_1 /TAXON_ID=35127 /ORGANISM="Thalassiosira sp., Strain NH16" /LENGTH=158 /DNA_ID=CAMNT_0023178827 /DNA_START=85 /DNA_END=561 /DNA_ORIENTATION=+
MSAKISGNGVSLPGEGYDAFIDFLYRTPSQPELLDMKKSDIMSAYRTAAAPKSDATVKYRIVGGPLSTRSLNTQQKNQSSKKQKQASKSNLVAEDNETWNKNYETLKTYQANHGNCSVPFGKETGALRSWTERQKRLYSSSRLDATRANKMTELGFAF